MSLTQTQSKNELRRRLRKARQSLSPSQRVRATRQVNRQLKRWIKRGRRIGVYWPMGSELRLDEFMATARQRGAQVWMPYIEPGRLRLWFTPYRPDTRAEYHHSKQRRIPQFDGRKMRAHRLNVLLLPLVGIDRQGYRLGQGGGYYDVTLAATGRYAVQPLKIGVGFACQRCAILPHEAHDMPADVFVCEQGIWWF